MSMIRRPTFEHERELRAMGYRYIVGIDEAGCGALAGPVVAGAVILPLDSRIGRLHDSKLLTPAWREKVYSQVVERSESWAAGIVTAIEIMEMGIKPAIYLAMRRAVGALPHSDYLLVDAWTLPGVDIPQRGIVNGDRLVKSIAAGSIIAKVTRDRIMRKMHEKYPGYAFNEHKGYGTMKHRERIKEHGPCPIHRLNYKTFRQ